MFRDYYSGLRVLVTGHTGFKGGWLSLWLRQLGAEVHGFSLPAPTQPNFHEVIGANTFASQAEGDLRDLAAVRQTVASVRPEIVFHLAAQPLVRLSYAEPLSTLATNVLGTAHLLEEVRAGGLPCNVIVITSDKCYENREWEHAYRENDAMGGHDIYSMSKGATELVAQAWHRSFFVPQPALGSVVTVRAGNVIGGGDYAADRLVPDCMRALMGGQPIQIRNPAAIRPWQHVLECLSGYLWLGARLATAPKASPLVSPFNFGPGPTARQTVRELVEEILQHWPGRWVDGSDPHQPHEAKLLSLAIDKAVALLGWQPVWDFPTTIAETVSWYHARHTAAGADLLEFSRSQITAYTQAAAAKQLAWAAA
jgi:CDP-glucose 4,6-dehydratase